MTSIYYDFNFSHPCANNRFRHGLGTGIIKRRIENDAKRLSLLVQNVKCIDIIIDIIKVNQKEILTSTKCFYFFINVIIDNEKVILTHKLNIINEDELNKQKFNPYIEYVLKM